MHQDLNISHGKSANRLAATALFLAATLCLLYLCPNARAEKINLPKDAEGWTIFTPSPDTRIVYIDESGNDATCKYYSPSDTEVGSDPFNPVGPLATCATMDHALSITRDGYPDWILFKRGGVYPHSNIIMNHEHSGRSASEPFLFAAYGKSGDLPSLRPDAGEYFYQMNMTNLHYIAFVNLEWYADIVDPDSPNWKGNPSNGGDGDTTNIANMGDLANRIRCYTKSGYHKIGFMWEGNRFKKVTFNLQPENVYGEYALEDAIFRRNTFLDTNNGAGTIQGTLSDILFEENIFDHSGWYDDNFPTDASGDRIKNHSIYIAFGHNSILKNNIFSRPSSIAMRLPVNDGTSNFIIYNNFIFDANIGLGLANNHGDIKYRCKTTTVSYNVFSNLSRSMISHQAIAWGLTFDGLDEVTFDHNLILSTADRLDTSMIIFYPGIASGGSAYHASPYKSRNSVFKNNIFQIPTGSGDAAVRIEGVVQIDNISFLNNIFDFGDNTASSGFFSYRDNSLAGGAGLIENNTTWSGNTYYRPNKDLTFWWPYNNGTNPNLNQQDWKTSYDTNASFSAPAYIDPTRTLETYMIHLGFNGGLNDFLNKIRLMDRYHWDENFTAKAINDWIRGGYFLHAVSDIKKE